ncbi:transmembrane inner ear expressed protein [Cephus cinctus]|uniref:Transmembrane inner ear expressed protein n=1 Tax=Cephus cinctus TaxID=211228 RepID=A0AAJ7RPX6_CEPCN|nr:transmembrane inner ear expressed protein [Cephus cinctus]XP_024944951.1 transmembrane inner ear expressed protein [Cephus cinctus]
MLELMNSTNSTQPKFMITTSTSQPCSPDEIPIGSGDCVGQGFEHWLEKQTVFGFRLWQLLGIIFSILLTVTIALCCCIRFRIPRTKQEIEADYIRKKITRNFRQELTKINDEEMDEMDLRRALDRVRTVFDAESELRKQQKEIMYDEPRSGFRARFNTMFNGMGVRFAKGESSEFNRVI